MTTTPFLELAKRIDADIEGMWYCCHKLPKSQSYWFTSMFRPTRPDTEKYRMYNVAWLQCRDLKLIENNQFRILILLLAHEVWLDENNNTKK